MLLLKVKAMWSLGSFTYVNFQLSGKWCCHTFSSEGTKIDEVISWFVDLLRRTLDLFLILCISSNCQNELIDVLSSLCEFFMVPQLVNL